MEIYYSDSEDLLHLRFSDRQVTREVSPSGNVNIGYSAEGQLVEITIFGVSKPLREEGEDRASLTLTERESRRMVELIESPPQRSEHFLAGRTRYRERLHDNEPSINADAFAWMTHQAKLLRTGSLNDVQRELLATFFEEQADVRRLEFEALLRRILIDRQRLEHNTSDMKLIEQLAEFRARAIHAIEASPSLREISASRIENLWHEARMALKHNVSFKENTPEIPDTCPYTIEQAIGDVVPTPAQESTEARDDAGNIASAIISHITPVGGNIFLDLGFPPEEAERLKEESDRRISARKGELNYVVFQEEGAFVARCLDVEVASDGATEAAAVAALKEALELYFENGTKSP